MSGEQSSPAPGPWTFEKQDGDEWWFGGNDRAQIVIKAGREIVAVLGACRDKETTAEADARVIAAAPDMLTALRRAALALAFAAETSPAMRDDYEVVSAAIAKATGASND